MSTMPMQGGGFADYELENQQLERRRRMAELLGQQSTNPLEPGRMVGNIYVPTSWTAHLANALKGPMSELEMRRVDQQQKDLANRAQGESTAEVRRFAELLRGNPGGNVDTRTSPDETGMVTTGAAAANPQAAMDFALGAKNPMLRQLAMQNLVKPEETYTLKPGEVRFQGTRQVAALPEKPTTHVVNGQIVQVAGDQAKPLGAPIPNQAPAENPRADLLVTGPDGKLIPNAALIGAKQSIARAGAAQGPVVNVNTAQKPMLTEIGKGVGESVITDFNNAKAAVQTLNNAQQIEAGLGKVIAGPVANARIKLAQIGEVLGVNGKDATEQLQNTRTVIQGLARQELAAAGQMKGQGQITESERGILRRAEAGDIQEMTVPELRTLLGAIRKTANYRINQHNQNVGRLAKDPNAAGVVDYLKIGAPQGQWTVER